MFLDSFDWDDFYLEETFSTQTVDELFEILSNEPIIVPDTRDMGTQTDLNDPDLCCALHCSARKRVGRRCAVHANKRDITLKEEVPICFKCDTETYSSAYKGCRNHEMEMGNIEGILGMDFYSRQVNFNQCISRRCYREATVGWRCRHHEKHGIKLFKFTMIKCKKCEREVYGKGNDYCKLHVKN